MTSPTFLWNGAPVAFRPGETIATALEAAGIRRYGTDPLGMPTRYFCGIGACQGCLVRIDGRLHEACSTPAVAGQRVEAMGGRDDRS
jgi:predicted molibdopterin-dependent oxidoreductase YjgC